MPLTAPGQEWLIDFASEELNETDNSIAARLRPPTIDGAAQAGRLTGECSLSRIAIS